MELDPVWEYVADTVMGGVSQGSITTGTVAGRAATRLTGRVSLENNGGFVQMAFSLSTGGERHDLSAFQGLEIDFCGNRESYELRVRTDQLTRPWQSFRAPFKSREIWTTLKIPFHTLQAHRTDATFDAARVRRIGILAIGRAFDADIAVAAIRLYR